MPTVRQTLYLDTARLGPMSPQAQRMLCDFGRLTAEDPASVYVEDFVRHGFAALPVEDQQRFAELCAWPGLAGWKTSLRQFVGAAADADVLVAGRSRSLMKLTARCLFQRCRNVLTTDLSWPAYQRLLEDEAHRTGQGVTQVAVRERLFEQQLSLDQLAVELAQAARRCRCDGLFLPAVDNLGIRVPVAEISEAIRQQCQLHFVANDAAQAIGHVSLLSDLEVSDLVIAGTHKWFGGYLPLGLAFLSNEQTRKEIVETSERMRANEDLDDPLLDFLADLEFGSLRTHSETVNLTPLLTCCGALQDFTRPDGRVELSLRHQLTNAETLRTLAEANGWQPLLAATDQRTGIVSLQSVRPSIQSLSAEALRRRMQQDGLAATAYEGGIIRLSMPRTVLEPESLRRIGIALQQLSADHNHSTTFDGYVPADGTTIAAC